MPRFRLTFFAATTLALAAAVTGAAQAAPANSHTFDLQLSCDDGNSYLLAVVDNQGQSPGHDEASNAIFVPTAFGVFHIVVRDSDGAVIDEETAPPEVSHGRSGEHVTALHCGFAQSETEVIPGHGEVTVAVDGTVDGFLSH